MKCKICDLFINDNNNKVPITNLHTKSTGYSYSSILKSFFEKPSLLFNASNGAWNSNDKDIVVCKTCAHLIEYYDKFYYEAKICFDLIMRQLHRTLRISNHNNKVSEQTGRDKFEILTQYDNDKEMHNTFKKQLDIFFCKKCDYKTIYSDTLVGHYKYHKLPEMIKTNIENDQADDDDIILGLESKSENESKAHSDVIQQEQQPNIEIIEMPEFLHNLSEIEEGETITEHSTSNDSIKIYIPLRKNHLVVENDQIEETNDSDAVIEHLNDVNVDENIITKPTVADVSLPSELNDDAPSHSESNVDSPVPIKCLYCKITLPNQARMIKHCMKAHMFCSKCNIQFTTKSDLLKHRYSIKHTGLYKCTRCSTKFKSAILRAEHECEQKAKKKAKAIFTGKCRYCGKQLNTANSLKSHEWVHRTNPKYVCVTCGLIFNNSATFNLHEKYHVSEKPFACDFCPLKLASISSKKVHMRIHTGERPFKCDYCDKVFKIMGAKREHIIAVHTKEYTLKCDICGSGMLNSKSLRSHYLSVHKKKLPVKPCEYKVKIRKTKLLEALE